jgi:hypothetical protein
MQMRDEIERLPWIQVVAVVGSYVSGELSGSGNIKKVGIGLRYD